MTNAEIFLYPGEILAGFALSLFGEYASSIDPQAFRFFSIIAALFFWAAAWRGFAAVIKKILGFENQG